MKNTLFFAAFLIAASITTKAQNLITVQHGGAPSFYTTLPDAVNNAMAGDTLYIPGGSWDAVTINKPLHLFGVGHNPDSTSATARTIINQINLVTGSDNGSVTGIQCSNGVLIESTNNYNISRCNIWTVSSDGNGGNQNITNISITECILQEVDLYGTGHTIYNDIFTGEAGYVIPLNKSTVRNSVFLKGPIGQFAPLIANNCTIENNIFEQETGTAYPVIGNGDIFNNNVNGGLGNGIINIGQGNGNFPGETSLQSIFVNYNAATTTGDAIYTADFSLLVSSPYKNAGTDGTDVGLYGGAFLWKPGSVPANPHFQAIKVAPKTDSSGNLKVQITVAAQNN
jgi:hypothetical protein